MKKILTTAIMILALIIGVSVAETTQAATLNINRIKNKKKVAATIRVNQTLKVRVKGKKVKKVKWKTSNKKIATISKKGIVRGKKPGKVTISAKVKKKVYKCKIKIKKAKKEKKLSFLDVNGSMLNQGIYLTDALYEKKNILVSPMSLNMTLGMVANGTVGDISPKAGPGTAAPDVYINPKWEVEQYLGKTTEEYNQYALDKMNDIKKDNVLKMANAVWYREDLDISREFTEKIQKNYYASVKKAPFNQKTLDEINGWAKENTDGMIDKILNEIDEYASTYILNALLFNGKWTDEIKPNDVSNEKFTKINGKKINVKMMKDEQDSYYENDYAIAFEKTYEKDQRYSFIGILPKEKGEFRLEELDIEGLLKKKKQGKAIVKFPKFSYKWNGKMKKALYSTSLNKLFIGGYDPLRIMFPELVENTYVDEILQSCKIEVDEKGTKAAAVTVVITKTAGFVITKNKEITLNRPFAYLIRDNNTGEILFVGKVVDPAAK